MTVKSASNKAASFVRGDSAKSSGAKFKASIFAILIGLLVGIIPILATGGDPILAYKTMFTAPFNEMNIETTWVMIAVFVLMGAGIGVSFKTGLFNIGASGQFLLAGTITFMMSLSMPLDKSIAVPLMIIVSAIIGAAAASIAGALKAFFNVHEVVSTILLNWIFFFLCKYFITLPQFKNTVNDSSQFFPTGSTLSTRPGSFDPILVILIAVVIVGLLALMFKYTAFGFKLKINGLSEGAAHYSGISTKMNTIYSMAISGALAGVAGYIYYSTVQGQIPALDRDLPTLGFDAITVTLLSFSSPMGSLPAGFFFAVMKAGVQPAGIAAGATSETMELMLGIIIFCTALAPILVKIKPIEYIRNQIMIQKSNVIQMKKKQRDEKISLEENKQDEIIAKLVEKRNSLESNFKSLEMQLHDSIKAINADSSLTKEQRNEKIYLATVQFNNKTASDKTITLSYVQKIWNDEIKFIKSEYRNKNIDIFRRDALIIDTNRRFKQIVNDNKLSEVEDAKSTKKQIIKSIKNDYKMFVNTQIASHFNKLNELAVKKSDEINLVEKNTKDHIRSLKNDKKDAINEVKARINDLEKNKNVSHELTIADAKITIETISTRTAERIVQAKLDANIEIEKIISNYKTNKSQVWSAWKEGK